jgi:signal transduction histidine kinase
MRPPALRLRLLATSAASILVALLLAGVVISALFARHVERDLRAGLGDEMNRIIALLDADAPELAMRQPMSDPRYSTPYGGIYWQVTDETSGATLRSRSVWDKTLVLTEPLPADGGLLETEIVDPEGTPALALARRLDFELDAGGTRALTIIAAEDRADLDQAITGFGFELFRALTILAVALFAASWVQIAVGLSPLSLIRRGVNAIRAGRAKALEGRFPVEVLPLVNEVNELLDAQERSISFARARAADLAHGLKTQLTVLNAEAADVRAKGNAEAADAIEQLTADMAETIDHQLRLARLRHRSRSEHYATALSPVVNKVAAALQRTPKGQAINWDVALPEGLAIDLDPSDLTELIGIVCDNAGKWGKARVVIAALGTQDWVRLTIDDDGEGLPDVAMAALGERGKRLDESRPGSGLGLSIAREIVTLNRGKLGFERSPLGGLRANIDLPPGRGAD